MRIYTATNGIQTKVYDPGEFVWVIEDKYTRKSYRITVPKKCRVESQEVWSEPGFPVYYNLTQPYSKRRIGRSCTGNWHFADVFETQEEALRYQIFDLENTIRSYRNLNDLTLKDTTYLKKHRAELRVYKELLENQKT